MAISTDSRNETDADAVATISVVTAAFNALAGLRHTAGSLNAQSCRDLQWVVIDGASTDGSVDWLRTVCAEHPGWVAISEPDRGIYDALNKALPWIRGDWVIFMGAGDTFLDASTLETCHARLSCLPEDRITLAYGGVIFTQSLAATEGTLCYERWRGTSGPWIAARPAMPCHQGIFHRRKLFHDGFRFDSRLRIAADAELVLRELLAGRGDDLDIVVARMPQGGVSTRRTNRLRLVAESVLVNWRVGIFWSRPWLQLALLGGNLIKHPLRLWLQRHS